MLTLPLVIAAIGIVATNICTGLLVWRMCRDKQKRTEATLLASERRYLAMLNAIPDQVFRINSQGRILDVLGNPEDAYLPSEKVIGRTLREVIQTSDFQPNFEKSIIEHIDRAISEQHMQAFEYQLNYPGRGPQNFEVRVAAASDNEVTAIVRNVTEVRRSERVAADRAQYLATLYRITLDLLNRREIDDLLQAIVDDVSSILDAPYGELMLIEGEHLAVRAFTANQAFLRGDSLRRGDGLLSWQAFDSHMPVVVEDYQKVLQPRAIYAENALTLRAVADFPIAIGDTCIGVLGLARSCDNQPFTEEQIQIGVMFSQLAALVVDNVRQYTAALQEIAERRALEQRRDQLTAELYAANRELKDFAYIISHDLKAPLRNISAISIWMRSDYADQLNEEARAMLELLHERVLRMEAMITGVLEYSRLGQKPTASLVDLNVIVGDIIKDIPLSGGLTIKIESPLPIIKTDPTRMRQLFQNLIDNSVKFLDKPMGVVQIDCKPDLAHWQFSVRDNGPGIPARDFDKIFQIFQTLRQQKEVEGNGIGLTIVKRIIETYEGNIWLESTVGEGSTFFFTLPRLPVT